MTAIATIKEVRGEALRALGTEATVQWDGAKLSVAEPSGSGPQISISGFGRGTAFGAAFRALELLPDYKAPRVPRAKKATKKKGTRKKAAL